MNREKTCPSCKKEKLLEGGFYRVKSRSDGYASWCKECSNSSRKFHKKSGKRPHYRIVSDIAATGGKPSICPDCHVAVPSHKMRGYVVNDDIKWACVSCRLATLADARKVTLFCDWCCEEFSVTPSGANKRFCGADCVESWRAAKRSAKAKDATKSTNS